MSRLAAVDVGTNSVLLLVAERGGDGAVRPVREEAEITRLGRGVDRTGVLSPEGMDATLEVLARFAGLARADGARGVGSAYQECAARCRKEIAGRDWDAGRDRAPRTVPS